MRSAESVSRSSSRRLLRCALQWTVRSLRHCCVVSPCLRTSGTADLLLRQRLLDAPRLCERLGYLEGRRALGSASKQHVLDEAPRQEAASPARARYDVEQPQDVALLPCASSDQSARPARLGKAKHPSDILTEHRVWQEVVRQAIGVAWDPEQRRDRVHQLMRKKLALRGSTELPSTDMG